MFWPPVETLNREAKGDVKFDLGPKVNSNIVTRILPVATYLGLMEIVSRVQRILQ